MIHIIIIKKIINFTAATYLVDWKQFWTYALSKLIYAPCMLLLKPLKALLTQHKRKAQLHEQSFSEQDRESSSRAGSLFQHYFLATPQNLQRRIAQNSFDGELIVVFQILNSISTYPCNETYRIQVMNNLSRQSLHFQGIVDCSFQSCFSVEALSSDEAQVLQVYHLCGMIHYYVNCLILPRSSQHHSQYQHLFWSN